MNVLCQVNMAPAIKVNTKVVSKPVTKFNGDGMRAMIVTNSPAVITKIKMSIKAINMVCPLFSYSIPMKTTGDKHVSREFSLQG